MPISCLPFWDRKMTAVLGHVFVQTCIDFQSRPPNTSRAGPKTWAIKPTFPEEVYSMVPLVAYAGFLEGEPNNAVWVQLHSKCVVRCWLGFHLGRRATLSGIIRHHDSDPMWSAQFPQCSGWGVKASDKWRYRIGHQDMQYAVGGQN